MVFIQISHLLNFLIETTISTATANQYKVKVGTIMEEPQIGLEKWMVAIGMLVNCEIGVPLNDSDRFAAAMLQVTGKRLAYAELTGRGTNTACHPGAGTGQKEPF